MGTPHTSRNQGKILKFHGIERVNLNVKVTRFVISDKSNVNTYANKIL